MINRDVCFLNTCQDAVFCSPVDEYICAGCLGALRILVIPGNAGTGMYQRGAEEHGCDFAPFAIYKRIVLKLLEPLAAGVVFAIGEQKAHPVKAVVRYPYYHFPFRSSHNNKCKGE